MHFAASPALSLPFPHSNKIVISIEAVYAFCETAQWRNPLLYRGIHTTQSYTGNRSQDPGHKPGSSHLEENPARKSLTAHHVHPPANPARAHARLAAHPR
jgi:hypothetical protein